MNIGNITAKWAALDPRRPAIVDVPTGRRVSFGELDERVRKLANGLCAQGLEKGARIGVLAKNSIEYFEVYYACARAGIDCSAPQLAPGGGRAFENPGGRRPQRHRHVRRVPRRAGRFAGSGGRAALARVRGL